MAVSRVVKFRRSRHLVAFWQNGTCVIQNFRKRTEVALTPETLRLLEATSDWSSAEDVARTIGLPAEPIRMILEALVDRSFMSASDCSQSPDPWEDWDPAAGFFHFSTRSILFNSDVAAGEQRLMAKALHTPPPAPTSARSGRRTSLPTGSPPSALEHVLRERRTWRTFAETPVSMQDLADLLRLTVGVQKWARGPARDRIALKTSPSGGICHPIEAYVVAARVEQVPSGIYHYDSASHELTSIQSGATSELINTLILSQPWYGNAAALILFTAVFERTMWRYPSAKAYRNILMEAGHVCQTFYLLATERGLAPFCTLAVDEDAIDRALGLDGVTEGVVYVAGCGQRPAEGWTLGLPHVEGWNDGEPGR